MALILDGPASETQGRAIRAAAPLVVLAGALAYWWLGQPFVFPVDDAYITLNNARALLSGADPNFGVSPLVGATSPTHLAMVALACLVLPPVAASFTVATLGVMAYAWGVATLAVRQGMSRLGAALLLMTALGGGFVVFQLFNGLETAWAMGAVTWAIVLAERPSRKLAILAGTLPFVRPELAALSVLLMGRQALLRRDLGQTAVDAALAIAAATPWLAWSWLETGALVANTLSAKAAFFADKDTGRIGAIPRALSGLLNGLGPALVAIPLARRNSLTWALWAFALVFTTAFLIVFPGGLSHNLFRYTYVLLPVALWSLTGGSRLRHLLLVVCALAWVGIGAVRTATLLPAARAGSADALRVGHWLQANTPSGTTILVHDVGGVAFTSDRPMIDIVGLKTPWATAYHQRFAATTAGRDRWRGTSAITRRSGARYAIIGHEPFWAVLGQELRAAGWTLTLVRPSPLPTSGYDVYRLTPPAAR